MDAAGKKTPRIEVRTFNPRLDLREHNLPWALYRISLRVVLYKLPSAGLEFVSVC